MESMEEKIDTAQPAPLGEAVCHDHSLGLADNFFAYHKAGTVDSKRHERIREAAKSFFVVLCECAPDCIEREQAIKSIREAMMWGNAAVSCCGARLRENAAQRAVWDAEDRLRQAKKNLDELGLK